MTDVSYSYVSKVITSPFYNHRFKCLEKRTFGFEFKNWTVLAAIWAQDGQNCTPALPFRFPLEPFLAFIGLRSLFQLPGRLVLRGNILGEPGKLDVLGLWLATSLLIFSLVSEPCTKCEFEIASQEHCIEGCCIWWMLSHPEPLLVPLLPSGVPLRALLNRGRRLEGAVLERGLKHVIQDQRFSDSRVKAPEHVQEDFNLGITLWFKLWFSEQANLIFKWNND